MIMSIFPKKKQKDNILDNIFMTWVVSLDDYTIYKKIHFLEDMKASNLEMKHEFENDGFEIISSGIGNDFMAVSADGTTYYFEVQDEEYPINPKQNEMKKKFGLNYFIIKG
jgi:hypothetical protein